MCVSVRECVTYLRYCNQIVGRYGLQVQLLNGQMEGGNAHAGHMLRLDSHAIEKTIHQAHCREQYIRWELVPHLQATQHIRRSITSAGSHLTL